MNNIYILGKSIKSIATATVMASLGHKVWLCANQDEVTEFLSTYSFEHQLIALWKLYISEQKIGFCDNNTIRTVCQTKPKNTLLWVFLDVLHTNLDSVTEKGSANNLNSNTNCHANNNLNNSSNSDLNNNVNSHLHDANQHTKINDNALNDAKKNAVSTEFCYNHPDVIQTSLPIIYSGIVPIGTVAKIADKSISSNILYLPFVFLTDGASHASMLHPSLMLIGEKTPDSLDKFSALAPLLRQAKQKHTTDIKTLEFTRNTMMAMLASRLSFINEMSRLADAMQIDIHQVQQMMALDSRIGSSYLNPGWGFGGDTLPSELAILEQSFANTHTDTRLIHAITAINDDQKELIFRKFWQYFDSFVKGKRVMIWGAGYKAGSGRTLNSAIHPLIKLLWQYDIITYVYDKPAKNELHQLYSDSSNQLVMAEDAFSTLTDCDALFIINWPDSVKPNSHKIAQIDMPVFDAQNLLSDEQIQSLSAYYTGLGRQKKP